jgi:type I restriction enzyme S subunit
MTEHCDAKNSTQHVQVIPPGISREWEVKRLGEVAKIVRGASPRPIDSPVWFDSQSSVHWVRIADVTRAGMFLSKTTQRLSPLGIQHSRPVRSGSLIMSICATVGRPVITQIDVCIHDGFVVFEDLRTDQRFLYYVLRWIEPNWANHGQTGSQMNLNTSLISGTVVTLPPLPEQRAIAAALSDVDALLDGLDRVIAKKCAIKQATMQQLLTGRTRLPGFSGEWEVKPLGEVFRITTGTSKSAFIGLNGDYWICDMGSVSTTGRLIVSKRTNYRGDFLSMGDLIMPKDDIGGGKIIGKVAYIDCDNTYVLSDHLYRLQAQVGDSRYLAYSINSHRTNQEILKKVIGSAQLGLGRKSVVEQDIEFPPLPEQTAIANVLSDMDVELEALEVRRHKTQQLKQGMMQELLTGRTRLV